MEGLTINKEQQVTYSQKEEGYVITSRDWKRIKSYLDKLNEPSNIWANVGWATFGIGLSCLVSWVFNYDNWLFLLFGVSGIVIAACSYFAVKREKKYYAGALENYRDVIIEIEDAIVPKDNE